MSLSDEEIRREMDSWKGFEDSLRAKDRELFKEMMSLCLEYAPSMQAKASPFPSESLLMSLLLVQQKTVVWLVKEVEELKKALSVDERMDT